MEDSSRPDTVPIRSFRDLTTWQCATDLAVNVDHTLAVLPHEHRFDLGGELRKTARSIPSNIAEGFCRHSRAAYRSHIVIALGSAAELETQIEIARRRGVIGTAGSTESLRRAQGVGGLLERLWQSPA